jgi:hypothetical protein
MNGTTLSIRMFGLAAVGAMIPAQISSAEAVTMEWVQRGDVVEDAGVSAGLAWGDFDNDGDPDLFIANWRGQRNLLYRNQDGALVRERHGPVAEDLAWSSGGAWGDYDGDGDLDLFVANQHNQHNQLYRNDGADGFSRVEDGDIVSDFGDSYSAAWGDYDGDGHLDLVVANSDKQPNFLYRNNGDSTFERIQNASWTADVDNSVGVSWADFDDDGDLDLFVANYAPEPNALYRNEGGGRLIRIMDGAIAEDVVSSLGGAWADYDNDGDLDLFIANSVGFFQPVADILYRNNGNGDFEKIENAATLHEGTSGGSSWADIDLDGDLDLLVVQYASPNRLYLNDGNGGLESVTDTFPLDLAHFSTGHEWADFDNDGDLDLAVANWQNQDNSLFGNPGNGNHWLRVSLRGEGGNRYAIGAKIRLATQRDDALVWQRRDVTAGASFRSQGPAAQTFGLGDSDRAAKLIVEWPSGRVEQLANLAADRTLTIREGRGVVAEREPEAKAPVIGDVLAAVAEQGDVEATVARYHELQRESPEAWDFGPDALSTLTLTLLRQGSVEIAVGIQEFTVEEFPRSGKARQLLVRLYAYVGRPEDARRALNSLVQDLDTLDGLSSDEREALQNELGFLNRHRSAN